MIHHLSLGVRDLHASARFCDGTLGTLDLRRVFEDDPRAAPVASPGQRGERRSRFMPAWPPLCSPMIQPPSTWLSMY